MNTVLPFPISLGMPGMVSYIPSFPCCFCCLLFSPRCWCCWCWEGKLMGSPCHRWVTDYLPVTWAHVKWEQWSGGRLKTRPHIEGLHNEKGLVKALQQCGLPLINEHFEVKSKSNETWNMGVKKLDRWITLLSDFWALNIMLITALYCCCLGFLSWCLQVLDLYFPMSLFFFFLWNGPFCSSGMLLPKAVP